MTKGKCSLLCVDHSFQSCHVYPRYVYRDLEVERGLVEVEGEEASGEQGRRTQAISNWKKGVLETQGNKQKQGHWRGVRKED